MPSASHPAASHPAEGALCVSCGLCCDNGMFGRVIVSQWEALKLKARGIAVVTYDDGERSFNQPCPRFANGCCGIYKSRPHTCRAYICEMLKELRNGTIDVTQAEHRIAAVKAARSAVTVQAGEVDPFDHRTRITDALERGEDPATLPGCTPELVQLETMLNQWFRTADYAKRVPPV
ncbi:MAG: YkgJ family cysteine cluster protein [Pseudomonadota bacterium]